MLDTEKDSLYHNLQDKSIAMLIEEMNTEDQKVPIAIKKELSAIEKLIQKVVEQMKKGGRLFYIGAGTSGRLGILDSSECPPTFGVPHDWVVGIIAGGDKAIRKAVEFAEDDLLQGFIDLEQYEIDKNDIVVGIAASGRTPYVIGALKKCQEVGIPTGCIVCASNSTVAQYADFPVQIVVGPEYVTGSTRMKSGTAQKLVLNMISTASMIQLGRVEGNKMVDMQLSNEKLIDRGTRMVMNLTNLDYAHAAELLKKEGSVRKAIDSFNAQ